MKYGEPRSTIFKFLTDYCKKTVYSCIKECEATQDQYEQQKHKIKVESPLKTTSEKNELSQKQIRHKITMVKR